MLFFLFSEDQLRRLFGRLGYEYGPDTARKTIDYYDRRTSHGSTLSFVVHAGVLAAIDPESSWERFLDALESDVGDVQRGTTREGVHMGVMCGTLDLVQRAYLGVDVRDGVVYFDPKLIGRLEGLSLPMQFRGTPIRVTVQRGELTVAALADGFSPRIRVGGRGGRPGGGPRRALRVHDLGRGRRARLGERRSMHGRFRGAILDVDGVLVDTPHERAWRDTLEELMDTQWSDIRGETSYSPQRFTSDVYRESIAGKPRMSGARAALDRFHVPDAEKRAEVYAQRKQQKVVALIEAGEFAVFDDALRFVVALKDARDPAGGSVVIQERRAGAPAGPARTGPLPARRARRGRLGPGPRARQAPSRDLPDRRAGAGPLAAGVLRGGGRRRGHRSGEGGGHGGARRGPRRTMSTS